MHYKNVWSEVPPAEVVNTPSRFGHAMGKYTVVVSDACNDCLKCVAVCPEEVFDARGREARSSQGPSVPGHRLLEKIESLHAQLSVQAQSGWVLNPSARALGDKRWTPDLLMSTWYMAETGTLPKNDLEYRIGGSGGGFDKLRFVFPKRLPRPGLDKAQIDTSVCLNKRNDGRPEIEIPIPVYGGGMSFGSISQITMLSRIRAFAAWGSFTCTGEGGYPEVLYPFRRPHHHPGGHRALWSKGRDHSTGQDR